MGTYFSEPEDPISRPAAAAISDHVFAVISNGQIALASPGGAATGVVVGGVTAAKEQVTIYTDGTMLVKAAGTVTAGKEVMVGAGGGAIDATFGNFEVAWAETGTTVVGDLVLVHLYERPHHQFGSGLGVGKVAKVSLTGNAIHGGVQAWQNPEAGTILVTKVITDLTTVATAAAKLDIGTTATSNVTASDNLIDGIDINATTGLLGLADGDGTNGKAQQKLATGKWVTFKEISGDASGAVLDVYVFYVLLS